jgi:hypothetical protein
MDTVATIKRLEDIRSQLLSWVKEIDSTITMLGSTSSSELKAFATISEIKDSALANRQNADSNEIIFEDYKKEESLKGKVIYILTTLNRFLHISEVARVIHQYEPDTDIREISAKLSPAFSGLNKEGVIVKVNPYHKNNQVFWGFDHWLDENRLIKPRHQHNKVFLKAKKAN